MKIIASLLLLTISLANTQIHAAAIVNGDFGTCDFTGWQKDTDGFGDVSGGNDFVINNNAGDCSASVNVDYYDPAGDIFGTPISEAFFGNTLFQEIDFSAAANSSFMLDIDYTVDSEITSNDQSFIADYFLIGLNDGLGNYFDQSGNFGFLVDATDIDGLFSQTLSFEIDNSYANQTGWFLDFQLVIGADGFGFVDAFGSTLQINSVTLTEVKQAVSAPGAFGLLTLGFLGLMLRRKSLLSKVSN